MTRVALDKILNEWKPKQIILSSSFVGRGDDSVSSEITRDDATLLLRDAFAKWIPESCDEKERQQRQQEISVGEGMLHTLQLTTGRMRDDEQASSL